MQLFARLSPATRGNLLIAAIPLALAVATRGLDALERHIAARYTALAELEASITGRRAELEALGATPGPAATFTGADFPIETGDGDTTHWTLCDLDTDHAGTCRCTRPPAHYTAADGATANPDDTAAAFFAEARAVI